MKLELIARRVFCRGGPPWPPVLLPWNLGYIVVYAGQRATVAEAQVRANRARDYLITVRHIKPDRVKAIDGGYRAELTVTLWIWPAEAEPPPLMPTVEAGQVEILYPKKRRSRKR